MNMKKTVKKMTAVLAGAAMLGATVMGAMAADLGDYPAPLIKDGVWNGKVVVGAAADATDIAGAAALGASLQTYSKVPVSVGGGVITVEGGWDEEYKLNLNINPNPLDDVDLPALQDRSIRHNRTDYDIREKIHIDGLKFQTNVDSSADKDFGTGIYLTTDSENKLEYRYVFEDAFNATSVNNDHPLEISFLGKDLKITNIDNTSMTLEASSSKFLEAGDKVTVEGVEVELVRVGSNSVIVEVDGVRAVIGNEKTKTFSRAEFEVEVESIFYEEGATDNGASLRLGAELSTTVNKGDSLELYGEPTKKEDAEWVWTWNVTGSDVLEYIAAENNIPRNRIDVSYSYERPALTVGEKLYFPNNFAFVEFAGFKDEVYNDLKVDFRNIRFNVDTGYQDVLLLSTGTNRVLYADGTRASEVAINNTLAIWYKDSRGDWQDTKEVLSNSTDKLYLQIDSDKTYMRGNATNGFWMEFPTTGGNEILAFDVNYSALESFGEEGEAETTDLRITAGSLSTSAIGAQDYGRRLAYGAYFEAPKAQFERDTFTVTVPRKEMEGILVAGAKGTSSTVSSTGGAYQIVAIPPADVGALDSEVMSMIGDVPMLVVGGPNANTVAASLLGVEQFSEEVLEYFEPNKAMIKLFEEQNAILVAGYHGKDTRAASLALADFEANKESFDGKMEVEVVVTGTSVTAINAPSN